MEIQELIARGRNGDKRSASRLITLIEQGGPVAQQVRSALWAYTGKAVVLGLTGPPGAGKSTLTNEITQYWRRQGLRVGILAVDPSSPFTGGAILGDRVRMGDLALDQGVLIRSMGTRGRLGGLSSACAGAVNVMDACGFDLIIIETVGVGQSEVEVVHVADVVAVISVPGLGDDVQSIKAGLMEIGDLFVVNKADRPDAERVALQLRAMLDLSPEQGVRDCPILMVSALNSTGIDALCQEIEGKMQTLKDDGTIALRRNARLRQELETLLQSQLMERFIDPLMKHDTFAPTFQQFLQREEDPYLWVESVLHRWETWTYE